MRKYDKARAEAWTKPMPSNLWITDTTIDRDGYLVLAGTSVHQEIKTLLPYVRKIAP